MLRIIQRGANVFLVGVFLGRNKHGKRRCHNKTIHGSKKDAQKYLTAALQERDLGTFAEPTRVTLDECLERSRGWHFEGPKTARSRRSVKLSPTLVQALQAHKKRQAAQRLKAGATYQNLDLVFAGEGGLPLHASNLTRRHFKPILKKAGLPSTFRLYDLRHTCATLLLAAGENPKVVSELLGHSTVRLTLDTYSHVLPDMQKGAVEKMEAMLFS